MFDRIGLLSKMAQQAPAAEDNGGDRISGREWAAWKRQMDQNAKHWKYYARNTGLKNMQGYGDHLRAIRSAYNSGSKMTRKEMQDTLNRAKQISQYVARNGGVDLNRQVMGVGPNVRNENINGSTRKMVEFSPGISVGLHDVPAEERDPATGEVIDSPEVLDYKNKLLSAVQRNASNEELNAILDSDPRDAYDAKRRMNENVMNTAAKRRQYYQSTGRNMTTYKRMADGSLYWGNPSAVRQPRTYSGVGRVPYGSLARKGGASNPGQGTANPVQRAAKPRQTLRNYRFS